MVVTIKKSSTKPATGGKPSGKGVKVVKDTTGPEIIMPDTPETIINMDAEADAEATICELMDEIGALEDQLFEHDSQVLEERKRLKECQSKVTELADKLGIQEKTEFVGEFRVGTVGPRAAKRTVKDQKALMTHIGAKAYFQHATFPLGKVDAYLTKDELDSYVDVAYTGSRPIKVKAKA